MKNRLKQGRHKTLAMGWLFMLLGVGACSDPVPTSRAQEPPSAAQAIVAMKADAMAAEIRRRAQRGPLLVNLWATWCLPCVRELPDFALASKQHPEIEFLGVSGDWLVATKETTLEQCLSGAQATWEKLEMPFPSLLLEEFDVEPLVEALDLPSGQFPQTILYRDGEQVAVHVDALTAEELESFLQPLLRD